MKATARYRLFAITCAFSMGLVGVGCGDGTNNPVPYSSVTATQNPLVAQYTIGAAHTGASGWVEFGTDTRYGRQTSVTTPTTAIHQSFSILVAGMRENTTYHMRAHVDWDGGSWVDQDRTFKTGSMPSNLVKPTLTASRPATGLTPSPGVELLDLISPTNAHVMDCLVSDLNGNIIWYYDLGVDPQGTGYSPQPIRALPNGHFLIGVFDLDVVREIDLAGNTIREVGMDWINQKLQEKGYSFQLEELHHDAIELPNGHWIVLGNSTQNLTNVSGYPGTTAVLGDQLVDIDPNGDIAWTWSSFDHLDVDRHPYFALPDWTHSNAIVYTPNDGNLLLSVRAQSWVLKIDYADGNGTGNVLWRLGQEGDIALAGADPSQWFYAQHFPFILSADGSQMRLAIFDDGNNRVLDNDGHICGLTGPDCESRGTIYRIDESTRSATLEWQDTPGLYTFWGGSIDQLANGNMEFDLSEPFRTQDPSGSQVMEVTQTASPQVVWQMVMSGANAYRAYRLPSLYPGVTWQQ